MSLVESLVEQTQFYPFFRLKEKTAVFVEMCNLIKVQNFMQKLPISNLTVSVTDPFFKEKEFNLFDVFWRSLKPSLCSF